MNAPVEFGIRIKVDGSQPSVDSIDKITDATSRAGVAAETATQRMSAAQKELSGVTAQTWMSATAAMAKNSDATAMVLAERMGNLHSLLTPTNLGIVALGVGVIGMAAAIAHGHEEMVAMDNALAVTNNYAGMTRAGIDAVLQEVQSFAKSKADDGRTQLEALNQQVVGLLTASNSSALSVADAIANLRSALPDAEAAQQRQATIDQEVAGLLVAANNSALSVEDAIANLQSVLPDAEEAQRELTLRQSEVEALLGLTTGVGDLQTTIDNFRNAQTAVTTANSNQSAIGSMYQDILGHGADSAGLASWMNVLNHGGTLDQVRAGIQNSPEKAIQDLYRSILGRAGSADEVHAWQMRSLGGTSIDDIRNAFLNSDEYLRNHSHMDGGVASGWSLVGEEGPELINFTNPARVYTASQTRAALSDGESDQAARETSAAIRRNTEVVERQNELLEQLVLEVRTGTESGHIDIRDLKQHLSYVVSKVAA